MGKAVGSVANYELKQVRCINVGVRASPQFTLSRDF